MIAIRYCMNCGQNVVVKYTIKGRMCKECELKCK